MNLYSTLSVACTAENETEFRGPKLANDPASALSEGKTIYIRAAESEGAPQNVLNFDPSRICFLSDIMLHIGALSALTPRGSDLTAKN